MYSTVPRPRRPRSNWLANSYALVGTAVTYNWELPLGGGLVVYGAVPGGRIEQVLSAKKAIVPPPYKCV